MTVKKSDLTIIFIGSPDFVVPVLETLAQHFKVVAVVTAPDKSRDRGKRIQPAPIKTAAQKHNITAFSPEKIKEIGSKIKTLKPDLIVVAAYGKLIPTDILAIPKYGCLNIHPSLLPKYRGPSPVASAILAGDKKTGVTIIKLTPEMDAGPILDQVKIKIKPTDTTLDLTKKLFDLSTPLIIETIKKLVAEKITPKPQNEKDVSFCQMIKKEMGQINWQKSADKIEREIRAFYQWPGSFTFWKQGKKQLKITKASVIKNEAGIDFGKVFLTNRKELAVACGKDALKIEEIQVEGKKPQEAKDFLNGYPGIIGQVLH